MLVWWLVWLFDKMFLSNKDKIPRYFSPIQCQTDRFHASTVAASKYSPNHPSSFVFLCYTWRFVYRMCQQISSLLPSGQWESRKLCAPLTWDACPLSPLISHLHSLVTTQSSASNTPVAFLHRKSFGVLLPFCLQVSGVIFSFYESYVFYEFREVW